MNGYSITSAADAAFVIIPVVLAFLLIWATAVAYRGRRPVTMTMLVGVCVAAWMAVTWMAAAQGVLRQWDATPPPLAVLVAGIVILAGLLAWSPLGRGLATAIPLWVLILVQAFRFPLELAMHAMYERGVMPGQMSYSGRNFDIFTGLTAIIVALIVRRGRARMIALAWNVMGLLLVANVTIVAILSTPLFRYFGDDRLNVWVTYPPYVWLPAVMVLAAIGGHLLIFRALRSSR